VSDLTRDDLSFILTTLSVTRAAFEAYPYESYEFRTERLAHVDAVTAKVRALRNSLPKRPERSTAPA
jgi:hypothetical protein